MRGSACLRSAPAASRRIGTIAAALLSLAALGAIGGGAPASAAASEPSFTPCPKLDGFSCTTLPVPLDRAAGLPGTIALHLARKLAGSTPSASAVIGLAGGPGQAALPYAKDMSRWIAPGLRSRDLIVFDQRGTGTSGPLSCRGEPAPRRNAIEACADQIGASRSGYSSTESVADIEAIREALGYEKLVLYGTSYGTKVAEQYAETYPSHVEALILDSVVLPEGIEPFYRPTFEAVPRVLAELCSRGACHGIATHPVAELAHLLTSPQRAARQRGIGSALRGTTTRADALIRLLIDGDLDPALRAMMPAAVHAAGSGRDALLARMLELDSGLAPTLPRKRRLLPAAEHSNTTLYIDTLCEDTQFPWNRESPPQQRIEEALRAIDGVPQSAFYPFRRADSPYEALAGGCAFWPYAPATAPSPGPLPDVPTLLLSGAQDLRTPTANARAVAAQIPDAQLLVVPYTGHSVLGSDVSGCAQRAVQAFFAGAEVMPCAAGRAKFPPTPLPAASLAAVRPEQGVTGKRGRTLAAALDAVAELDDELVVAEAVSGRRLPSGSTFDGLRGGEASVEGKSVRFERFSFVPGVTITGIQAIGKREPPPARLIVGGTSADHGAITIEEGGRARGHLAGRRFSLSLRGMARIALARERGHAQPLR